ncbi:hypothetical protein ACGFI9_20965 [Micromonospora sp. NPDC048930]|uniref:hypothetical protein n=1 Tax=Micromonospora sp. NPDC048930 TaxID=3364261 RepID=UPI003715EBA1
MRRRSTLLAAVFLLNGCTAVGGSGPPPAQVVVPTPSRAAGTEVRRVEVGVPRWYDRPYVEFGDADHGYALFASCAGQPPSSDCPARLYATDDGGRTWHRVPHPRPLASGQRLEVIADVPALRVVGDGWYYSLDQGTSFRRDAGPARPGVLDALRAPVKVDERTGELVRWQRGTWRPLPTPSPVTRPTSVHGADGLVVVTRVAAGRPLLAVSFDGGLTWQRPRLVTLEGPVATLRVAASPAGDVWLIGERAEPGRFPALWHYDGEWRPIVPPRDPGPYTSMVPFGESRLAVSGREGGAVVVADGNGDLWEKSWPLQGDQRLTLLADGALLARGPEDLLIGRGDEPQWVRIVVESRRPRTDE